MPRANLKPRTVRARELRLFATDAERALWSHLRNRQLEGCKFRRQAPIDRFIADFACLERKLVIELDGGQHVDQVRYDTARTKVLETAGWTVLRFWNHEVLQSREGVLMAIRAALIAAAP
jgi:very-short-patch-repair endonuclease